LKEKEIIICKAAEITFKKLEFQIVHVGLENKMIAKFNQRIDAENYAELILRGYVQFGGKD